MKTILTLPDGSAFDSSYVAAITWDKARPGEYGGPACIRIYTAREPMLGFSMKSAPQLEQTHYLPMADDETAEKTCRELVAGWTGRVMVKDAALS